MENENSYEIIKFCLKIKIACAHLQMGLNICQNFKIFHKVVSKFMCGQNYVYGRKDRNDSIQPKLRSFAGV